MTRRWQWVTLATEAAANPRDASLQSSVARCAIFDCATNRKYHTHRLHHLVSRCGRVATVPPLRNAQRFDAGASASSASSPPHWRRIRLRPRPAGRRAEWDRTTPGARRGVPLRRHGGNTALTLGPLAARATGSYDGAISWAGSTAWQTFKLACKLLLATPTVLRRSSVAAG